MLPNEIERLRSTGKHSSGDQPAEYTPGMAHEARHREHPHVEAVRAHAQTGEDVAPFPRAGRAGVGERRDLGLLGQQPGQKLLLHQGVDRTAAERQQGGTGTFGVVVVWVVKGGAQGAREVVADQAGVQVARDG